MDPLHFETSIDHLSSLKLHYLVIPSTVLFKLNGNEESGKFNQRLIVKVNDSISWQAGIVALGEGNGYIAISMARMKKLGVERYDTVHVSLTKDNSEYGQEFPAELVEVLAQDLEAEKRFKELTPGKQRTLIYYILQVKSSDKRIERSLLFMKNLKSLLPGKETMRGLFGKE